MLSGKRIILGVTGGIAAYKAAILLRALQKKEAEVRVTMTPAATRFVGRDTLSALSRHTVPIHIFPDEGQSPDSWTRHIGWGEWADLFIIAPCTANTLAKIAGGTADNMLTSTVLAARCPLLICPTMDGEMYHSPPVQKNLEQIEKFGYHLLDPQAGYLASGQTGKGRLPETDAIIEKAEAILAAKKAAGPLSGKKMLVTAGPTREHIDPVRFISNPSSGKMGFAMAEAARDLGADVTLLHGPVELDQPPDIQASSFQNADDLMGLVKTHQDADIVIMAAAVADFTPEKPVNHKIKKDEASENLKLKRTPDILAWLGDRKKDRQILIGFAMETENLVENARKKLTEKNLDWIVANAPNDPDAGFGADTNSVHLIGQNKDCQFSGTKNEVAAKILEVIFDA